MDLHEKEGVRTVLDMNGVTPTLRGDFKAL
jgi:hypothetical protein